MYMLLLYILSMFTQNNSLPNNIKDKLESEFVQYSHVEFEVKRTPDNWNKIRLNNKEDINVIGNTAYVPVLEVDRKGETKRKTISVKVKLFNMVYVSVKNIKRRTEINPADFELVEKEVTSVRGEIVTSLGDVIGARTKRDIRKGDILTQLSIEKVPIISAGDKVRAVSAVGNVAVSFSAIAKQEGSVGDIIRIRNSENEIFKAKIIDNKNVLIIE